MTIYLAKDSNAVVSHCRCDPALIRYPAQADCPRCGCGWLFTCMSCRWVGDMSHLLADVEVGHRYVYLDGRVLRAGLGPVSFSGWYASHRFAHVPQVVAEADLSALGVEIGREQYWRSNALPE